MSAIQLCRTAALGGHTEACVDCGLVRCAYNPERQPAIEAGDETSRLAGYS